MFVFLLHDFGGIKYRKSSFLSKKVIFCWTTKLLNRWNKTEKSLCFWFLRWSHFTLSFYLSNIILILCRYSLLFQVIFVVYLRFKTFYTIILCLTIWQIMSLSLIFIAFAKLVKRYCIRLSFLVFVFVSCLDRSLSNITFVR